MNKNSNSVAAVPDRRFIFVRAVGRLCQTPYSQFPLAFIAMCLSLVSATSFAQTSDNVAEREVQRRQAAMPQGEEALKRGKTAMKAKNYTLANQEFKTAAGSLPDSVMSGTAHDEAVDGVCKSGVILAQTRITQGDYTGAEAILSEPVRSRAGAVRPPDRAGIGLTWNEEAVARHARGASAPRGSPGTH